MTITAALSTSHRGSAGVDPPCSQSMTPLSAYDTLRPRPCGRDAQVTIWQDGRVEAVCRTHAATIIRENQAALAVQKAMFAYVEEVIAQIKLQYLFLRLRPHSPWSWLTALETLQAAIPALQGEPLRGESITDPPAAPAHPEVEYCPPPP